MHYATTEQLRAAMDADPTLAQRMRDATDEALKSPGFGNMFGAHQALAPAVCPLCQATAPFTKEPEPCALHRDRASAVDGWLPDLDPLVPSTA